MRQLTAIAAKDHMHKVCMFIPNTDDNPPLWWLSPLFALTGFLLLAGFHFGEADTQALPVSVSAR